MTDVFRKRSGRLRAGQVVLGLAGMLLLAPLPTRAIITYGEPGRNLQPPTSEYANSGWQYEGLWGGFAGTAIGPHHFLTAKHCGGTVGDVFEFDGRYFETIARTPVPDCDLTVWTITGTLPRWAALYEGRREEGREVVLCGRGTTRGRPVMIGGVQKGWLWGPQDGRLSWGTNWIMGTLPGGGSDSPLAEGDKIVFDFSAYAGPTEGAVSSGDSGGGLFLREKGKWVLAGVLYGASSSYSQRIGPSMFRDFEAAIYDADGLWRKTADGESYVRAVSGDPTRGASLSIATRVSSYTSFIKSVLAKPVRNDYLTNRRAATYALGVLLLTVVLLGNYVAAARRTDTLPPAPVA